MYTKPVGEIIKWHNIKYHCYADDTQVYMTLKLCDKWDDISTSMGYSGIHLRGSAASDPVLYLF